jgi:hypothetical protein
MNYSKIILFQNQNTQSLFLSQPQNSMPDVIIWMLCGNERTAYYRLPAHELLYSSKADCKGDLCSKLQTVVLKVNNTIM